MASIAELEVRRLEAQRLLDSGRNAEARNRAGQFATPADLAEQIASVAHEHWQGRTETVRFLEPSLGTGSFYSALRRVFPDAQVRAAVGMEIDPHFAQAAVALWEATGLRVLQSDFTKAQPPPAPERFSLILANPPYVRHHHLGKEEKRQLQKVVEQRLGIRVSGLAGLYCYFLLLADAWLSEGGLAAWLIPSEFMDVNYGRALKRYLTEHVTLLRIHRFCPSDVQFADALVSSVVVLFAKTAPAEQHGVTCTLGGTLARPEVAQQIPLATLRRTRKWTSYPRVSASSRKEGDTRFALSNLFTIKRGLATGANDFFIVPREQALQWGIPPAFLKPILPSPRRLSAQVIEAAADGYPKLDPCLALIDCDLAEEAVRAQYPAFWEYLRTGKQRGVQEGYLASRRSPWYTQEKRQPAPFLCTYMGRTGNGRRPFRFIWNKSAAVASNLYLLLYPRSRLRAALAADAGLYAALFTALQSIGVEQFLEEGRVYGGGLYKMEPSELGRLPADGILQAAGGLDLSRQGSLFSEM